MTTDDRQFPIVSKIACAIVAATLIAIHLKKTGSVSPLEYDSIVVPSVRRRLAAQVPSRPVIVLSSELPHLRGNPYSSPSTPASPPFRILHIITTLSDRNDGSRGTKRGEDRFASILVPTLVHAVDGFVSRGWHVDVVLILGFKKLSDDHDRLINDSLPKGVKLEVWSDASPLGYDADRHKSNNNNVFGLMKPITRALARQHRYVVRDMLDRYDFFSVWEDDMRVGAEQVEAFLKMSDDIDRLRKAAEVDGTDEKAGEFGGKMTAKQLRHTVPGFIRVEVMSPDLMKDPTINFTKFSDNVPVDEAISGKLSATSCCSSTVSDHRIPLNSSAKNLMTWECGLAGMSVRKFPGAMEWMALLPGPRAREVQRLGFEPVTGYWTGSDGDFKGIDFSGYQRPEARHPRFFTQQGGWMATRDQVATFDEICREGFLPPFKPSELRSDGLDPKQPHNVEFWSGGFQLFGTCNIQRVLSLNPEVFSKQLLYHSSNNKQRTIVQKERLKAVHELYGQLVTIVQRAQKKLTA
mmetsp:Transcript_12617/g.25255  ORF Transcript_12617/g.25255 Transcript_12617/m.25255 type:complete len:522 (-) Transcript_12617:196-1761(-)